MFNESLITNNYENAFEIRRLNILYKQAGVSGFLGLVIAFVIANLADQLLMISGMSMWVLIQTIIVILRAIVSRKVLKALEEGSTNYKLYHNLLISSLLASGISWGGGMYLYMPGAENIELMVLCITVISGMASLSIIGTILSVRSCHAYIIPLSLGLGIHYLELGYYSSFFSIVIYYIFLTLAIYRLNKTVSKAIYADLENEKLIEQIKIEKNLAEQSNIEKSHFMAAASHDLRQPLNSLSLFHYSLRESLKNVQDEKPLLILNRAEQSYHSIKNLFDSLLEISSLDAGTVKAENKTVKLQFIIQPIIDEMAEIANDKNIELHYEPSQCYVETDPILLSRILRNLISNAIKYSEEGTVDVIEIDQIGQINILIQDMGIGIPEAEFDTIFNEYHQLANKKRDRRQGIGLGLSIVKKMCDVINANISVTSQLGVGSTFTLNISTTDPIDIDQEDISSFELNDELSDIKVLVLDDETDILVAMKMLFSIWGMKIETAENYQQGNEILKHFIPDVIICDYRIQDDLNGIEVIERLRQDCKKDIQALIITGDTDPKLLKTINDQGFYMLSKPINPKILQQEISKLLK